MISNNEIIIHEVKKLRHKTKLLLLDFILKEITALRNQMKLKVFETVCRSHQIDQ
jgi:hypothetical protein